MLASYLRLPPRLWPDVFRHLPQRVCALALLGAGPAHAQELVLSDQSLAQGWDLLANPNDAATSLHGGGLALVDLDGDGWLDVFLARKSLPNVHLRNTGGAFVDVSATTGVQLPVRPWQGVSAGDVDADGDPDLLLLGHDGMALLLNDGAGSFTEQPGTGLEDARWPVMSAAFGDFDNDGDLDVYAGNHTRYPELFLDEHPTHFPDDMCVANSLYVQVAPLVFEDHAEALGVGNAGCTLAVAASDLDGDGWVDLYSSNDYGLFVEPDGLYYNNGVDATGALRPFTPDPDLAPAIYGMGIGFGDYDRDADLDLYLSNTGPNLLLQHIGKAYVDVATAAGCALDSESPDNGKVSWGTALEDLNLDGWPDVYVVNGNVRDFLFLNGQDGTFAHAREAVLPKPPGQPYQFSAAFGDWDQDGDVDIVTGGLARGGDELLRGAYTLLRNEQDTGHAWLQLDLVGTLGHPDAIGARVQLEVGEALLVQEVSGGTSYGSSSPHTLTFGLGAFPAGEPEQVDRLVVRWPSGAVQTLVDVPARQRLRIVEAPDPADPDTALDSAPDSAAGPDPKDRRCGCSAGADAAGGWVLGLGLLLGVRRRSPRAGSGATLRAWACETASNRSSRTR